MGQIKNKLQEILGQLKEQAGQMGKTAKEKSHKMIEAWIEVVPILIKEGFHLQSFSISLSLNPSCEMELFSTAEDFDDSRLESLISTYSNRSVKSVFKTIKMTRAMYEKIQEIVPEPLILRIRIQVTPEIKVIFGRPMLA